MSEEQRNRIESLLRGLDGTIGAGIDDYSNYSDEGSDDSGDESSDEDVDPVTAAAAQQLARELQQLGFAERDAAAAVRAVGGGREGLPAALDWLCLSLPEDRLPRAFGPGGCRVCALRWLLGCQWWWSARFEGQLLH